MSVLVKGMEMPESCIDCEIKQYDDYEDDCVCPFSGVVCLSIGRQDACPLVALPDKHGRLVDADALRVVGHQGRYESLLQSTRHHDVYDKGQGGQRMIISPECDGLRRQVGDCIASAYTKGYKKGTADAQAQKNNDVIWDALSKVYNMDTVPEYAKSIIGDVMLLLDEPDKEDGE